MSQSYLQFSEAVLNLTTEEQTWFRAAIDEDNVLAEDGENSPLDGIDILFEDEGETLWISAEEGGDPSAVGDLIVEFLAKFRPTETWSLTYSETCSQQMVGAFGGGAILCTAKGYEAMNAHGWLTQEETTRKVLRTLLNSGDDTGCDGLVVVDAEAFAALEALLR